jgi:hypothetical protein
VLLALGFVVWVRWRRVRSGGPGEGGDDGEGKGVEAW